MKFMRVSKAQTAVGERSGTEPSEERCRYVKLAVLSGMAARQTAHRDWILYRNVRLMTADFLTRRMKVWEAIRIYLEGLRSGSKWRNEWQRAEGPRTTCGISQFDPRQAFTAPAVLKQVRRNRKARNKQGGLGELFCGGVEIGRARVALPLSPEVCWARLEMGFNGPREAETR